jgi:amidase
VELTRYLQAGDFTVEQYVLCLLSRISSREKDVKAWAYLSPPDIIAVPRSLDQTPVEQRGPLFGVPVAVKDIIQTKGEPLDISSCC